MSILVVGDLNADLTATLPFLPQPGDDCTVTSLTWGGGGSAANTAIALARIGAPVRLLARVGSDPVAEVALHAARAAGVDLSQIQIDPTTATGLCYAAILPSGERSFLAFRGANTDLTVADLDVALADITWLHLSGYALISGPQRESALRLLHGAHQRAIPVSLDLCPPLLRAHRAELHHLLPVLSVLFANELEIQMLAHGLASDNAQLAQLAESAAQIQAQGRTLCVVAKCGARGCLVAEQSQVQHLIGYDVQAVDTNGCGDAFVAGYIAAWQRSASPTSAARVGNLLGATAATRSGAAESLPDLASLRAFSLRYGETETALVDLLQTT
jgi:ribokinase